MYYVSITLINVISGPIALAYDIMTICKGGYISLGSFLKLLKLLTIPGVKGIFQGIFFYIIFRGYKCIFIDFSSIFGNIRYNNCVSLNN